eukprot:g116.t1
MAPSLLSLPACGAYRFRMHAFQWQRVMEGDVFRGCSHARGCRDVKRLQIALRRIDGGWAAFLATVALAPAEDLR